MIAAALASLTCAIVIAGVAPRLAGALHPALATRLLAIAGVAAALTTVWVAALAFGALIARIPFIADVGQWSPEVIVANDPLPDWLSVVGGAFAGWALVACVRRVRTWRRRVRELRPLLRRAAVDGLVVIDDQSVHAFAFGGRRGRIVVSTGMLRALSPTEQRALIAHEASHLSHRHAWWIGSAELAAAANPLLRATARAVGHCAERWADEDAAAQVGDRMVVARAVARAALHTRGTGPATALPALPAAMAVDGGRVPDRVAALMAPAPRRRLAPAGLLVVLAAGGCLTAGVVNDHADKMLDQARTPYAVHHHHRR